MGHERVRLGTGKHNDPLISLASATVTFFGLSGRGHRRLV